jgi:methylated-DNA-protein-cysteine methyltransferase-like protein
MARYHSPERTSTSPDPVPGRYERIYTIVSQIPYGQVATYGQVAEMAGLPGHARLVGYALYRVALPDRSIPWHRVINAQGKVSESPNRNGSDRLQRDLLEAEGVHFNADQRIDLKRYGWRFDLVLF